MRRAGIGVDHGLVEQDARGEEAGHSAAIVLRRAEDVGGPGDRPPDHRLRRGRLAYLDCVPARRGSSHSAPGGPEATRRSGGYRRSPRRRTPRTRGRDSRRPGARWRSTRTRWAIRSVRLAWTSWGSTRKRWRSSGDDSGAGLARGRISLCPARSPAPPPARPCPTPGACRTRVAAPGSWCSILPPTVSSLPASPWAAAMPTTWEPTARGRSERASTSRSSSSTPTVRTGSPFRRGGLCTVVYVPKSRVLGRMRPVCHSSQCPHGRT